MKNSETYTVKITCFECGDHIGYATDSGPGPICCCDNCISESDDEDED